MERPSLDRAVDALQQQKAVWANLPLVQKIGLLEATRDRLGARSADWVAASAQAKGIDPASPWVGEEWLSGPWAVVTTINGYLGTLQALAEGRLPKLKSVRTRPNGQVVAHVFPNTIFDQILFSGIAAEVWMQPEVRAANLGEQMAAFYRQKNPQGAVALVLGAGNINSIPPLDTLYRLFTFGHVVLLKMNPINAYLAPVLEDVFAPFMRYGFLRVVTGGADVGRYLANHSAVDELHLTGSARTHDVIVYGEGDAGAARKARNQPLLTKPVTSELGGVGPTIIVPGPWSKADIRYQAEHVVTMKLHNGGFNCVASQVLVLPAAWDQAGAFLDAVRQLLRDTPPRNAYYPGAAERQREAAAAYPQAELFGGEVPRTLIANLDPSADESCFRTEFFGAVLAQTSLPGANAGEYLRNAVQFCNARLQGTLGASIIIHPATIAELGPELEEEIAQLRYGAVSVNLWNAVAFLLAHTTWGAYPGHSLNDVQSGIGIVRNAFLFDRPEKTVAYGPFRPFPRSWLHGEAAMLPRPPWFVTNTTALATVQRVTEFAFDPGYRRLPRILLSALRG